MKNLRPNRCYVIAEAGLNHNGSVDMAKALIDVAGIAGVDAVKFQKRHVPTLATRDVLDAPDDRFPSLGRTYREIRDRLELSRDAYVTLKRYAEAKGLDFICTPFDQPSVDFLESIGLKTYKFASHSVTNLPLLRYVARKCASEKGRHIILSTGMCTLDELDRAVAVLKTIAQSFTILHCVSSYPQAVSESNLALIPTLRSRYGVSVGYSGHEIGWLPTLVAVAMGATMVERHFTLDNTLEGFDHKISLEPHELIEMVKTIRQIETAVGSGEKSVSEREWITRRKYHVSMVSSRAIPKGTPISEDLITYRNPGTGIPPKDAEMVLGKAAVIDIPEDTLIKREMVGIFHPTK